VNKMEKKLFALGYRKLGEAPVPGAPVYVVLGLGRRGFWFRPKDQPQQGGDGDREPVVPDDGRHQKEGSL
jgi:hypothetical protein